MHLVGFLLTLNYDTQNHEFKIPYQHFEGRNCYKTSTTLKNICSVSLQNVLTHLLGQILNTLAEAVVILTFVPELLVSNRVLDTDCSG